MQTFFWPKSKTHCIDQEHSLSQDIGLLLTIHIGLKFGFLIFEMDGIMTLNF